MTFFGVRRTVTKLPPAPPPLPPPEQIPQPVPDALEGFRACMMQTLLEYRGKRDGKGAFGLYRAAVEAEVERFRRKPLDLATMREVEAIARRAVERVRRLGFVAFEGN
jgi:hypothetical protein